MAVVQLLILIPKLVLQDSYSVFWKMGNIKRRVWLNYLLKKKPSANEIQKKTANVLGDAVSSKIMIWKWALKFKHGHTINEDDPAVDAQKVQLQILLKLSVAQLLSRGRLLLVRNIFGGHILPCTGVNWWISAQTIPTLKMSSDGGPKNICHKQQSTTT